MNAFEKAVSDAGFSGLPHAAIAHRLSVGVPYVQQLLRGKKPISDPIRAKLDALIAAKDDGPGEVEEVSVAFMTAPHGIEPVEQFEVDLPGPALMGSANPQRLGFEVIKQPGKQEFLVVEVDAVFSNEERAHRYCDMLNKEGG